MDFTPLIVCGSVALIFCSLSLFSVACYKVFNSFKVIDNKKIYYNGDIYEKKD